MTVASGTKPSRDTISYQTWQGLYDLAVRVCELAPWEWMIETDVFGVEMPASNRTIFVSVMGTLGEHLAVAVYPSPDAVRTFWAFAADEHAEPERILEIPQIQVSFEKSNQLEPDDRRVLKQLGLTFKGNRWPLFRSYKPGFAPWFLEFEEAEMLCAALEQLLEVAPRIRTDPSLLWPEADSDSDVCLIRFCRSTGTTAEWADDFRPVVSSQNEVVYMELDGREVQRYRSLPQMRNTIEADFFLLPTPIAEGKSRPKLPYALMFVDSETGIVLAHELIRVETSIRDMWAGMPALLMNTLIRLQFRAMRVIVRPGPFAVIAEVLSKTLGFELSVQRRLPSLNRAKASLFRFCRT